jgi:hypothetical protein
MEEQPRATQRDNANSPSSNRKPVNAEALPKVTREEEFLLAAYQSPVPDGWQFEKPGFDWVAIAGFSDEEKHKFLQRWINDNDAEGISFSGGFGFLSDNGKLRARSIQGRRASPLTDPRATQESSLLDMPPFNSKAAAEAANPKTPRQRLTDRTLFEDGGKLAGAERNHTPAQEELRRMEREAEAEAERHRVLFGCYDEALATDAGCFDLV